MQRNANEFAVGFDPPAARVRRDELLERPGKVVADTLRVPAEGRHDLGTGWHAGCVRVVLGAAGIPPPVTRLARLVWLAVLAGI